MKLKEKKYNVKLIFVLSVKSFQTEEVKYLILYENLQSLQIKCFYGHIQISNRWSISN